MLHGTGISTYIKLGVFAWAEVQYSSTMVRDGYRICHLRSAGGSSGASNQDPQRRSRRGAHGVFFGADLREPGATAARDVVDVAHHFGVRK